MGRCQQQIDTRLVEGMASLRRGEKAGDRQQRAARLLAGQVGDDPGNPVVCKQGDAGRAPGGQQCRQLLDPAGKFGTVYGALAIVEQPGARPQASAEVVQQIGDRGGAIHRLASFAASWPTVASVSWSTDSSR